MNITYWKNKGTSKVQQKTKLFCSVPVISVDFFVGEWKYLSVCWTRTHNRESLENHIEVCECDDSERLRHRLGIYCVGSVWEKFHIRI